MIKLAKFLHQYKESNPANWLKMVTFLSSVLGALEYAKVNGIIDNQYLLTCIQIATILRLAVTSSKTTQFVNGTTTKENELPSGPDTGGTLDGNSETL